MEILDPANTILEDLYTRLESTTAPWGDDGGDGMLRSSDDSEYAIAYSFYSTRVEAARAELDGYVYLSADCLLYGSCYTGDTGSADTGGDTDSDEDSGDTDTSETETGGTADTVYLDSGI